MIGFLCRVSPWSLSTLSLQQCISGQQLGPCLPLALTVVSTQLNCEALTELEIEGATVDLVASLLTVRLTFLFLQLPVSQTIFMDPEEKYSQTETWKEGLSSCRGELSYPQGPRISGQYSEHWRLMSQLRNDATPSAPTLLSSAQSLDFTEVETQQLGQLMGWSEANWCSHMEFGVNKRCFKITFLCPLCLSHHHKEAIVPKKTRRRCGN